MRGRRRSAALQFVTRRAIDLDRVEAPDTVSPWELSRRGAHAAGDAPLALAR